MLLFPEMRTTALAALIAEGCYACAQACVCKSYEWQPHVTAEPMAFLDSEVWSFRNGLKYLYIYIYIYIYIYLIQ
jgi:hypothetical protein